MFRNRIPYHSHILCERNDYHTIYRLEDDCRRGGTRRGRNREHQRNRNHAHGTTRYNSHSRLDLAF